MKQHLRTYFIAALLLLAIYQTELHAQGCVAVRQMGGINPLSTNGYTLAKGEFQIGTNYRYFHSFRHYVGTEEQPQRQNTGGGFDSNGNEKGNAVNIYSHAVDLNISYGITDRLQVNLFIPYVNNERSQVLATKTDPVTKQTLEGVRYSMWASGLADIRLTANYLVFDPAKAMNGNLLVGLGVKLNSGNYAAKDNALILDPVTKQPAYQKQYVDQAIQPGDGGIGISVEVQGYKRLHKGLYGFANGYYLFNPRESNGTYKSAPTVVKDQNGNVLGTLYGYNVYASPDQFFVRAGVMTSVLKSKNLVLSLAARMEGIPVYDVFGGNAAYRRPGYVVAAEPGVTYRAGKHIFGLFVPVNFIRNRTQSAADIANQNLQNSAITDESKKVTVHGDAAFADYSISVSYGYRLGKLFSKKAADPNPFETVK
jgi:hypothetical protein